MWRNDDTALTQQPKLVAERRQRHPEEEGEIAYTRRIYLEVTGDFAGSAAVIVAGVVIVATGVTTADAIASALIAVLILPRTWGLVRDAVDVLSRQPRRGST